MRGWRECGVEEALIEAQRLVDQPENQKNKKMVGNKNEPIGRSPLSSKKFYECHPYHRIGAGTNGVSIFHLYQHQIGYDSIPHNTNRYGLFIIYFSSN